MDYSGICFVIMPFGTKRVGDADIDFDAIYEDIFRPAIERVPLPEGGFLEPRRTDHDFHTGLISQDMFEYIEYSRIAIADITGLNANVFYELGHRHRARTAGTVILRQTDAPIPFDINQIKAFMYQFRPAAQAEESRELISKVLTESLERLRIDSPIRQALRDQQEDGEALAALLREAENAIRARDTLTAIDRYQAATRAHPENALTQLQLGVLFKADGRWQEAAERFQAAIDRIPGYVEAHRELGIAQNKLATDEERTSETPPGLESLRRAVELDPRDFDAQASMGGVLKRAGRLQESLAAYNEASEASNGHPYPLLNALSLRVHLESSGELSPRDKRRLKRAVRARGAQYSNEPPLDSPWSLFDLAQGHLMLGEGDRFLELLDEMDELDLADWQIETFLNTLRFLAPAGLAGLDEGIAKLEAELA